MTHPIPICPTSQTQTKSHGPVLPEVLPVALEILAVKARAPLPVPGFQPSSLFLSSLRHLVRKLTRRTQRRSLVKSGTLLSLHRRLVWYAFCNFMPLNSSLSHLVLHNISNIYSFSLLQICLILLLVIYLADFFNLLYHVKPSSPIAYHRYKSFSDNHRHASANHHIRPSETFNSSHPPSSHMHETNSSRASNDGTQTSLTANGPTATNMVPTSRSDTTVNSEGGHSGDLENHPMNHNIEELQVPENTGVLSQDAVRDYYRRLAKAYLTTFTGGIHRQMYFDILRRRTYSLTPPGANKGVQTILFQIIDSKVYMMDPYEVPRNSKPFYRTRINQVIWLLSKLVEDGRIKNTEFLMAIHDCVQTVNKPHTYRGAHYQESNPAFTIVSCNFSNNIPFPMWEGSKHRDGGFSGWDQTVKQYAEDDIPWEKKQDRAVFRGGNRPSMYFRNKTMANMHCNDIGRTRLLYLSKQQPDILDVSIGGTCGGVHTALDRLDPKDHHKFKYILYAEGNCMWADRSRHQVFGPSTIIKQETPCGQFFEPLLRPNTHYIPTDFFFTDTVEKIHWARQNDEKARYMVKNANEFAKNFLTLNGIETYVQVLLEEYTSLLVEPDIKLENGAMEVTNRKV